MTARTLVIFALYTVAGALLGVLLACLAFQSVIPAALAALSGTLSFAVAWLVLSAKRGRR